MNKDKLIDKLYMTTMSLNTIHQTLLGLPNFIAQLTESFEQLGDKLSKEKNENRT